MKISIRPSSRVRVGVLLAAALVGVPDAYAQLPPSANPSVNEAVGAGLQTDVARALRVLKARPASEFTGRDAEYRACMLERFGGAKPPRADAAAEGFAADALRAFRLYWHGSLLDPATRDVNQTALARTLGGLLKHTGAESETMDALEPRVLARLRADGYHALMGRTGPMRELMMWRKQESKLYRVKLPEGEHETRVEILDDFVSLGWADYATCGRRGAGGWATADALFAVRPRYASLDGEEFRVTFLGHETQHFADLKKYAPMESWELEYRAKLAELAQASETRARVLAKFSEDQSNDPRSPHSYANKRVLDALRARLGAAGDSDLNAAPVADLQRAAAALLAEDSGRRTLRPR